MQPATNPPPATPPARRWRRRVLAAAVGFVAALAAAELLLRLVTDHQPVYLIADDQLGFRLRAGTEGVFTLEGRASYRINSHGWRDEEHELEKPEGVLRIAVLGDSFTQAMQVELQQTYWWLLGERLRAAGWPPGKRTEVLNFGVAGYGTAQELIVLREHVWAFDPDIVLLAFVTGNDLANNVRQIEQAHHRPYFVMHGGVLSVDNRFLETEDYATRSGWPAQAVTFLADHLRLMQLINRARAASRVQPGRTVGELGLSDAVYRGAGGPWGRAWRLTTHLLETMHDEVTARGAHFAMCLVSNGIQVHPDPAVQAAYRAECGVETLSYPNHRLAKIAADRGIPLLDLVPPLAEHARRTGEAVHGFGEELGRGHWNPTGHLLAAEALAEWLPTLGWW